MLSRALKEHNAKSAALKEQQEERKHTAVASIGRFSDRLVEGLNADVEHAYNNQRHLETQAKRLQQHVGDLAKQTQAWTQMLEQFNDSLKELGDVDNWARTIETDITTIACALEYAYKGAGPNNATPSNAGVGSNIAAGFETNNSGAGSNSADKAASAT